MCRIRFIVLRCWGREKVDNKAEKVEFHCKKIKVVITNKIITLKINFKKFIAMNDIQILSLIILASIRYCHYCFVIAILIGV